VFSVAVAVIQSGHFCLVRIAHMARKKIRQQPPEVLAMVLADHIHRDPGNGKFFILGTYSVIAAAEFPVTHPVIQVYASLIDGRGPTPLKLILVDSG
jgi:hypothetical protein